jgi:hypothetical protein
MVKAGLSNSTFLLIDFSLFQAVAVGFARGICGSAEGESPSRGCAPQLGCPHQGRARGIST